MTVHFCSQSANEQTLVILVIIFKKINRDTENNRDTEKIIPLKYLSNFCNSLNASN